MIEIGKIELLCLHVSYRLAFMDAEDHRGESTDRANQLKKVISQQGVPLNNRFVRYFLDKFSKLDLLWLDRVYHEKMDLVKELLGKYNYHYSRVTCCGSCHTGTSDTTKKEIQKQRALFGGIFICKHCSKNAEKIDSFDLTKKLFTGEGFYENKGLRNPDQKMLGFAGRRIIIKKTNGELILTNNLFHITSLHKVFYEKVKHRINCELIWVHRFTMECLLEKLTIEEIESLRPQLLKAEEYGHKI